MAQSVLDLAELVATETGVEPVIYTGAWWLGQYCTPDPALARYPLWLSAYPLGNTRAPSDEEATNWFKVGKYCAPPAPWQEVTAWQFTSIAHTQGVRGYCDRSIVADLADLYQHPSTEDDLTDEEHIILVNLQQRALTPEQIAALFDPTNGLYQKVNTLQATVDKIVKKLGA
jgi:hypothetical protein